FWFCYPALFVFGGLSIALVAQMGRQGWRFGGDWLAAFLLPLFSFDVLYKYSIRVQRDQFLLDFWHDYFPPYAHPLAAVAWLPKRLWEMYCYLQMPSGGLLLIVAMA